MGLLSDHLIHIAAGIRNGFPCMDAELLERAADEIKRLSGGRAHVAQVASGLTHRQRDAMLIIQQAFDATGIMPSFDEIMVGLGLKSKGGVKRLVAGLEERGYIKRIPNRRRAIAILKRVDDKFEPVPATSHSLAEARKDGGAIFPSASPSINPRTGDLSHGDCGRRTEDKGSDEAAPVRVAGGPVTLVPVNSSHPAESFEPGGLTPAGYEGAGDGDSAPRTPVTSMTSTDHARSGGLHVEDDLALPAFLDRRGHG